MAPHKLDLSTSEAMDPNRPRSTATKMQTTLRNTMNTITSQSTQYLDAVLPPQARDQYRDTLIDTATRKPYLTSFIVSQLLITGIPLLFITSMALMFASIVAMFIATMTGLFFLGVGSVFAVFVVLPVVVVASSVAFFTWGWIAVGILALRLLRTKGKGDSPLINGSESQRQYPGIDGMKAEGGEKVVFVDRYDQF